MKKITLVVCFMLLGAVLFGQNQQDFNRWSIELEAGVHKPAIPFTSGYYTSTPSFFQGSLGVRYMLTNRFGLKLGVGYNSIEGADESRPFKTNYKRLTLQGVINAGDILNFRSWTNTINLLVHGGMGSAKLTPTEPAEYPDDEDDYMGHFIAGITPQLKLTDHIVLTGDFSVLVNERQNYKWDGTTYTTQAGFDGILLNGSVGLTFYIGGAEQHADWYTGGVASELDSLNKRISKIKEGMLDSDNDGVSNYLDEESNSANGVIVNTKGITVDKNQNGIPDEWENNLDKRYASAAVSGLTVADLLNRGYVAVYFKFDSAEPEAYALNAINYLIIYMTEHPSATAELIGYADAIGNEQYNQELSLARSQKVKDILVAAGIDENRLTIAGRGEDTSLEEGSKPVRQLVRRVVFKLK